MNAINQPDDEEMISRRDNYVRTYKRFGGCDHGRDSFRASEPNVSINQVRHRLKTVLVMKQNFPLLARSQLLPNPPS